MKRSVIYQCCLAVMMLFASLNAFAQNAISGTVVSANNEPIIGAAIIDVASKDGVITDMDGKFTINTTAGATIEVSCLG